MLDSMAIYSCFEYICINYKLHDDFIDDPVNFLGIKDRIYIPAVHIDQHVYTLGI